MAEWDWEKAISNVPQNVESKGLRRKMRIIKGSYLANEGDFDFVSKFKPISLLSINEKLTVGIIENAFNGFFRGVKYIKESMKKARILHLPKSVEHASATWE